MSADTALAELLAQLKQASYNFIAVTPQTHRRVLARPTSNPPGLRDIFGWNRSFTTADLGPKLFALLERAEALEPLGAGAFKSKVRVASLAGDLFLHSAFPTESADAVFFGPDTYRFARLMTARLPALEDHAWLVDMGAGTGAGAIVAARYADYRRLTLVDVNERALRLARLNAIAAGVSVETLVAGQIPEGADLIVANPPYMIDAGRRAYRDGGDMFGGAVALDWSMQALQRLAPGGTMLLYTGAAIVAGRSPLVDELERACARVGAELSIEEIDADVFGEELGGETYQAVERIAAVGAVIRSPGPPNSRRR